MQAAAEHAILSSFASSEHIIKHVRFQRTQSMHLQHAIKQVRSPRTPFQSSNHYTAPLHVYLHAPHVPAYVKQPHKSHTEKLSDRVVISRDAPHLRAAYIFPRSRRAKAR